MMPFAFSLSALALAGLAAAIILPALLGHRPLNRDDRDRQNIRIARFRLAELAQEGGNVGGEDAATRAQAREEVELALLDDLSGAGDVDAAGDSDSPEQAGQAGQAGTQPRPPKTPGMAATALILALFPLVGVGLYLTLGEPTALLPDTPATAGHNSAGGGGGDGLPSVETLVRQLEQKLADNPADTDGWMLAGRTYMTLRQYPKAVRAYRNLHQLTGDDPNTLASWADAEIMAAGGTFTQPALARIERALELAPGHITALWLAALGAESHGDFPRARAYFERLLPLVENDPAATAEVSRQIAGMQGKGGGETAQPAVAQPTVAEPAKSVATKASTEGTEGLSVQVALDPALGSKVHAGQQVYIFAKAVEGPRAPLAVSRHTVADLPVTVTLDDSMSMLPGMQISNFEQVSVMARVSRSGNPVAAPGDIESGAVISRTDNQTQLNLLLNRVVK